MARKRRKHGEETVEGEGAETLEERKEQPLEAGEGEVTGLVVNQCEDQVTVKFDQAPVDPDADPDKPRKPPKASCTVTVAHDCQVTLDGVPVSVTDLRPGDKVKLPADVAEHDELDAIEAVRPDRVKQRLKATT